MISALMPARSIHQHHTQLYAITCRGCRKTFWERSECCWPLPHYCGRCIQVENPHFDHHFAQEIDR